jgi:hypothetical protein
MHDSTHPNAHAVGLVHRVHKDAPLEGTFKVGQRRHLAPQVGPLADELVDVIGLVLKALQGVGEEAAAPTQAVWAYLVVVKGKMQVQQATPCGYAL